MFKRDSDFQTITYAEPHATGCPVGPKGTPGWDGDEKYNPKIQACRQLEGIKEDAINVVKRLRKIAGSDDPNSRDVDSDLDPALCYHLYNLFYAVSDLSKELEKLTTDD